MYDHVVQVQVQVQVLAPGDVTYAIDARRLTLTRRDVGLSATTD